MDKQREAFEAWYSNWASSNWEPSFGEVWDAACEWQAALSHAEGEAPNIYWVLFDATSDKKYIKKLADDGSLLFYDTEDEAMHARRLYPGTDYQRVEYYTHPAPQVAVPEGWMWFPVEAWAFLAGEGPLGGVHFGDDVYDDKTGRRKPFWWRSHIRAMLAAAPTAPAGVPDAGALTEFEKEGITKRAKEEREEREGLAVSDPDGLPSWADAEEVHGRPEVFEALFNFSHDSTSDNAINVVQTIVQAARAPTPDEPVPWPKREDITEDMRAGFERLYRAKAERDGRTLERNDQGAYAHLTVDADWIFYQRAWADALEATAPDEREIAARALSDFADHLERTTLGGHEQAEGALQVAEEMREEAERLRAGKEGQE